MDKARSENVPQGTRERLAAGVGRMSNSRILQGRLWGAIVVFCITWAIVASLTLVWLNIERMDINYFINLERSRLLEKQNLRAKLEVERERLFSPYELRLKAEKLGMKEPAPGQIRRLELEQGAPAYR